MAEDCEKFLNVPQDSKNIEESGLSLMKKIFPPRNQKNQKELWSSNLM